MSYKIQGKDIVISGFESGIAKSPYLGISDMRNINPISIPGEASVAFATTNSQPLVSSATFTADPATDFITWSGMASAGNVSDRLAITVSNSGGALPTGLLANTTYYVRNSTSTTFQVSTTPGGSIVNITGAGSGTNSFSTINIDRPTYGCSGRALGNTVDNYYFMLDLSNRAWYWTGLFWMFLNNPSGTTFKGCGIIAWHNYLFVFHDTSIDYFPFNGLPTTTDTWTANWKTITACSIHEAIVGSTDDSVYFCNLTTVGSFFQIAGTTFDPTNTATYEYEPIALQLPVAEFAQSISQLQTDILVGGISNVVYSWNRINPGYTPIFLAENNTAKIVSANTTAYFFTGNRGNIYLCNGSQAQRFVKVPDHLSGTTSPLYTWGGAALQRNQIFFGLQATSNSGSAINQYGGLWALDLDTKILWIQNQLSYGNYSGRPTVVLPQIGTGIDQGINLFVGWMNTITTEADGIDRTYSTSYTGGQSYVDSDLIPVGTFLEPKSITQLEWKTSVPIGSGGTSESISLYYRKNFNDSYTLLGTTTSSTGVLVGGTPAFSDNYTVDFQEAQWLQIRAVLTSNATTPTYNRLTEIRIRDFNPPK